MEICTTGKCTACGSCVYKCPKQGISIKNNEYGIPVAMVDEAKCVQCGLCQRVCPVSNPPAVHFPQACYAAWHKDDRKRAKSASGGIAAALTEKCIASGGIVYGADYQNHSFSLCRADALEQAESFAGSKYVQCNVGNAYREVAEDLKKGKKVLFIGTPCQNAGLLAAVGAHENLLCIDLICHGVPAQGYLQDYIKEILHRDFSECKMISFRDAEGWNIKVQNCNSQIIYQKSHQLDQYYKAFLNGTTYRENCYTCPWAQSNRVSDITLGDFWGLGVKESFAYPKEKVSVVLINTEKGNAFFETNSSEIVKVSRSIAEAIDGNEQLRHPSLFGDDAKVFHNEIRGKSFLAALKCTKAYKTVRKENIMQVVLAIVRSIVPRKIYECMKNCLESIARR